MARVRVRRSWRRARSSAVRSPALINIFAWQGKNFDAAHGTLTNRISAFGINAIVAEVYKSESWFDKKECIVLDYSKTSLVAKHVRDEIREIAPRNLSRPGLLGR